MAKPFPKPSDAHMEKNMGRKVVIIHVIEIEKKLKS